MTGIITSIVAGSAFVCAVAALLRVRRLRVRLNDLGWRLAKLSHRISILESHVTIMLGDGLDVPATLKPGQSTPPGTSGPSSSP